MAIAFWQLVDCAGDAALDRRVRPQALTPRRVRSEILAPLLARHPAPDARAADHLHALALLWHDQLDEAHALVQQHEGDAGADLLHALLHRREGDYGNARYWFAEAAGHALCRRVWAELGPPSRTLDLAGADGGLDPGLMVEAVRAACAGERASAALIGLQRSEFAALAALLPGQ